MCPRHLLQYGIFHDFVSVWVTRFPVVLVLLTSITVSLGRQQHAHTAGQLMMRAEISTQYMSWRATWLPGHKTEGAGGGTEGGGGTRGGGLGAARRAGTGASDAAAQAPVHRRQFPTCPDWSSEASNVSH